MNKKAKIYNSGDALCADLHPTAKAELAHVESYLAHVNGHLLPLLRQRGFNVNVEQIILITQNPSLMPGGNTEHWKSMSAPDVKFLRYSGKKLILNAVNFKEAFTA